MNLRDKQTLDMSELDNACGGISRRAFGQPDELFAGPHGFAPNAHVGFAPANNANNAAATLAGFFPVQGTAHAPVAAPRAAAAAQQQNPLAAFSSLAQQLPGLLGKLGGGGAKGGGAQGAGQKGGGQGEDGEREGGDEAGEKDDDLGGNDPAGEDLGGDDLGGNDLGGDDLGGADFGGFE